MRHTLLRWILALFCLSLSAGAFAEEALSLEKSRQAALANSKTLQKYLLAVDTSVLAEKSDSYGKLPSVSASAHCCRY